MSKCLESRWIIPFAGFLLTLMGGIAYAWGVFIVPLETAYGWSRAAAALPVSIYMFCYTTTGMLLGGYLQDKYGPRKIALIGAALFFIAYMLAQMIDSVPYLWWVLLTYSLLGGTAAGFVYCVVVPTSRKWFPDKASLAMGIGVTGFGLAAVFFAPLMSGSIAARGIADTFLILAMVTGGVSLLAALVIRNPEPGWSPPGWDHATQAASSMFTPQRESTLGEALKNPLFYFLWATFLTLMFGGLLAMAHLVPYGISILGLERVDAAYAMVFFGLANGFGRTLAGLIALKFGPIKVMLVTYLVTALTFFLFNTIATTQATLYACALIFGWGFAVALGLFPTLTSISFGLKSLGAIYGAVIIFFGISAIFGPVVGGLLYDISKTYTVPFALAGGLTLVGWALALFALKMKYKLP